jgi:hypothetical protein
MGKKEKKEIQNKTKIKQIKIKQKIKHVESYKKAREIMKIEGMKKATLHILEYC